MALAVAVHGACTPLEPGDVEPGCEHARPPPRPAAAGAEVATGGDGPPLVFAARTADTGAAQDEDGEFAYTRRGFDLDGLCTGQGDGPGCVVPAWAEEIADGPGGRDYSGNNLAATVSLFPTSRLALVTSSLMVPANSGHDTFLLRVRGYNGEPDDDRLHVEFIGATLWDSPEIPRVPRWDGRDRWHPFSNWLDDPGELGRFADSEAYVNDYTLVANIKKVLIGAPPYPPFPMHQVIITGVFEKEADGVSLVSVSLSGRTAVDDMLRYLAVTFEQEEQICRPLQDYRLGRNVFCARLDLRATDNDPNLPCDAMSIVTGFAMGPAQLGEVVDLPRLEIPECELLTCADP